MHDGGPRLSKNSPELVWVTVTGAEKFLQESGGKRSSLPLSLKVDEAIGN